MTFIPFNIDEIRQQFPQFVHSKPMIETEDPFVFLDNAATTQKPTCVLETLLNCYQQPHTNVHRGQFNGVQHLTDQYEHGREVVQHFIHAKTADEIIWTSGCTDSLNLVAYSYAMPHLQKGDHIFVSQMEHHANILPWFEVAKKTGALLKVIPLVATGQLDINYLEQNLSEQSKIIAITQMSNVTGAINDLALITKLAHKVNAIVVVDGAQGVANQSINVQKLDIDFYAFSGHKLYATNGTGVLYGKAQLLAQMQPWRVGGKTINKVSFNDVLYSKPPHCFEAGTPNISGVLTLASAIQWLQQYDPDDIKDYRLKLANYAQKELKSIDNIEFICPQVESSIISFNHTDIHFTDIALLLAQRNIGIRSGRHCAHPLFDWLKIKGCLRLSLGIYNNNDDIDLFIAGLKEAITICT